MSRPRTRPLNIALIAHIRHPIAEPFMGGMEAHSHQLARALTKAGHRVTLFASGDSEVDCDLHPLLPAHYDRTLPWHQYHGTAELTALLDDAYARALPHLRDFDVVHNNSLHRFPLEFARSAGVPMLTSLHIPPFKVLHSAVAQAAAPWCHFTVTSRTQRQTWWPEAAPPEAHVLYNGIDTDRFGFNTRGNGRAIWAGRITPSKGPHLAAAAAQRAGIGLSIWGSIEDADYFDTHLRPLLGEDIRYEGHACAAELAHEMAAASVLLFTPLWDEPFGLVAAEAMACGTPVASLGNGAAAEVIGAGGVIAYECTAQALALATRRALALDRGDVRRWAESRYSLERMTDRCLTLYDKVMEGMPIPTRQSRNSPTPKMPAAPALDTAA